MKTPTKSQTDIIQFPYTPNTTLKVIAGPGSGKTYTLLCKVRHLIDTEQLKPSEIVILSLTNKAIDNITDNLLQVFQERNDGKYTVSEVDEIVSQIGIYTIHGLSNRVVTENMGIVNIIEENGWRGLVKLIPKEFWTKRKINTTNDRFITKKLQKLLAEYQIDSKDIDETIEKLTKLMKYSNVLTNDDLIKMAVEFLKTPNSEIDCSFTKFILDEAKVIIIDEFQDLHPGIIRLLETIIGHKQLLLFGDTNQSIYEFLGSNKEVMNELDRLKPEGQKFTKYIYDNFRCTPEISSTANAVINRSICSDISPEHVVKKDPSNVLPIKYNCDELIDELDFIVSEICQLACSSAKLSDIAILTRTNAHSKAIADHLNTFGIPVTKLTAKPDWMSDQRIRFVIDIIQLAVSTIEEADLPDNAPLTMRTKSDFSVIVTLAALKGFGSNTLQKIHESATAGNTSIWRFLNESPTSQWGLTPAVTKKVENYSRVMSSLMNDPPILTIEQPHTLIEKCSDVISKLDLPLFVGNDRAELKSFELNLKEFYMAMKMVTLNKPHGLSLASWFLQTFHDQSILCHNNPSSLTDNGQSLGSVNVSTIHSSKGLEFPVVFLMGRSDYGNFPIESNLLYVAMTRARNLLYLTNVQHRSLLTLPTQKFSLMKNEEFWRYFNRDMNRNFNLPNGDNALNFKRLRTKFGLQNRLFHTFSRGIKMIRK
ncbi:unnamed protein product [Kluyveromyces dobzhanskii CBS 2104]|uniref:DNA 3'-5' helicase n=1 Tax=Kluyveromyces dobzhanskii CBS 2104 TaxID=1427455 RepID=A0A0A8L1T5_9SACH|nr:unnamed protein product [Kluyveromyces dobzhanskii CBS 2104]